MTTINLTYSGKALSPDQKAQLADRITETFANVEVGNDAPVIRRGFMTTFHHLDVHDHYLGTEPAAEQSPGKRAVQITVRVMAGPWNNAMKAELFEHVDNIVRDILAMPKESTGDDIWMTFLEVPEGAWGLGGRTVSIAQIAPVFAADRQERIKAYLTPAP